MVLLSSWWALACGSACTARPLYTATPAGCVLLTNPACADHLLLASLGAALPHQVEFAQPLGRLGELCANAVLEDSWLELVRHPLMHDRVVPVALDIGLESLDRVAPAHGQLLAARHRPTIEALQPLADQLRVCCRDQVNKGIAEPSLLSKIGGKVYKIILASEALAVQEIHHHGAIVIVWQVPQHHRGHLRCRHNCWCVPRLLPGLGSCRGWYPPDARNVLRLAHLSRTLGWNMGG